MDFDAINENTQRIMPSIFLNLRNHTDVPDFARMRGAFKYAWSRTTEMLHSGRNLFLALNEAGIDYRILKGAAIQVVSNRLGSRTMADIDVLIAASDVDRLIEVMAEQGFRRNTHSQCSGHSSQAHHDALDFNAGDCHIDVHVAQYKEPSHLLQRMLALPAIRVRAAGAELPLPPPELLLLHAAFHGAQAAGPTDFAQSVVDVMALHRMVDQVDLVEQAKRSRTITSLIALNAATQSVDAVSLTVRIPTHTRIQSWIRDRAHRIGMVMAESNSVIQRIAARRQGAQELRIIRGQFQGKRRLYLTWLRTGRFAVTERMVAKFAGGFLDEPQRTWVSGSTCAAFDRDNDGSICGSMTPGQALDWRFRVQFAKPQAEITVRLSSAALDKLDAYLFCNGRGVARVIAGDSASQTVIIRNVAASAEFSIRAFWDVCAQCYQGFNDLRVQIDLRDATEV